MPEQVTPLTGETRVSRTSLELLTTLDSPVFGGALETAIPLLGAQYGAVVLVEKEWLWFRSRFGIPEASTPREGRLWDDAIAAEEPFGVEDLLADPRFADGSATMGGAPIRFFASSVFRSQDGQPTGLVCVASPEPVELDARGRGALGSLATYIERQLAAIHELDRAAEVQRALLPKKVPPLDGYQVAGACVPSKAVGGDFFDWYAIEGGMAFTLAGVTGEGVGAAIIAATVRTTIRTAKRDDDVIHAAERAAAALEEDLSEAGSFVTLFHARLRAADGSISFVDAGHGLSVVVAADGTARRLSTTDPPLGGTSTGDSLSLHEQDVILEPGGTFVTCSDGVLALYDGTPASLDRVVDIVRRASSAQEVADEIERLARRDGAPDDVTIVVITRLAG